MTTKTDLDKKIEARIKESEEKNIDGKARTIAHALGSYLPSRDSRDDGGTATYKEEPFEIESGSGCISDADGAIGWCGTTVTFNGKIVYQQGGGKVSRFIPGAWEEPYDALYKKASRVARRDAKKHTEEEEAKRVEKEQEMKKNWGL